ncbi:hypothetical protein PAPYR_9082 [Paratrimastix pyriformis]|uniref:RWD domain-containing protein n=1 Tax=Paratrimastix pyriformis TaxID=342808 RepID=A0ABQ8UAU0_9EUKA|nr:hypothetical protein PAPYR_9082 [Paratrimastix pyriformis]
MSFDLKDEIWALGRLFPAVTVQDRVVHLPFVMGAVKCTITFNLPEGYPTDLPVISIEPGHEGLKDSEGRLVEALQAKAAEQKVSCCRLSSSLHFGVLLLGNRAITLFFPSRSDGWLQRVKLRWLLISMLSISRRRVGRFLSLRSGSFI